MSALAKALSWKQRRDRVRAAKANPLSSTPLAKGLTTITRKQAPTIWHLIRQRSSYVVKLKDPVHFKHWVYLLHRAVPLAGVADSGEQRAYVAAPPQHGKTWTTLWGLAWLCLDERTFSHAYMTFSAKRAQTINKAFRKVLDACGVKWSGDLATITLANGTTIQFVSIQQGLTGSPINGALIVDDLYKEQKDADSEVYRENVETMWGNSVVGRLHEGSSVIVLGTRWHPADWYGKLVDEYGYKSLKLPAFAEENDPNGREIGEVLAPFIHSAEYLRAKQRSMLALAWSALYQCNPRVRGAGVFQQPAFYSVLPTTGYRGAYGIDLAYTADTTSDESGCLELWRVEGKTPDLPLFYVIDIWYDRCLIERTAEILQGKHASAPAWPMCWRCSGTERGSAMLLKAAPYRLPIAVRNVSTDKLVSNTAVAVAWNDGRVLLPDFAAFPEKAERIKRLLNQCLDFTGSGKEHDDLVDCLGNAHVELRGVSGVKTQTARSARA